MRSVLVNYISNDKTEISHTQAQQNDESASINGAPIMIIV